jgi:hypothetical protein
MNAKKTKADPPEEQGALDHSIDKSGSEMQNKQTGSPPTDEQETPPEKQPPAPTVEPPAGQASLDPPAPVVPPEQAPDFTPSENPPHAQAQDPHDVPVHEPEVGGFVRQATEAEIEHSKDVAAQEVTDPKPVSADVEPDSPEIKALKADERQPAEKEPGPPPIDSATLQVAPLPGAENLESLNIPSEEELAKLDQVDPVRAAGLRRQRDWIHDSKKIFKGDSREELERKENIRQMDELDARERQRRKDEELEKARQEKIATRDARILAIGNRLNELELEAQSLISERNALYDLSE